MSYLEDFYKRQEARKEKRRQKYKDYCDGKIARYVNNLEDFLKIWDELEDVTTEKNREKAYFILRDKDDGFKLYFWKSGFVKKQNECGSQCLFLNNWYRLVDEIKEGKMFPYRLETLIQHAHEFMISKKVFNNVDRYFEEKKRKENILKNGGFSYIDDETGEEVWVT